MKYKVSSNKSKGFRKWIAVFSIVVAAMGTSHAQVAYTQQNAEQFYKKAIELYETRNYSASRNSFSEFLAVASSNDPRSGEAEFYRASAALQLQNSDGETLIQNFLTNYPNHPLKTSAQLELAQLFYQKQNYAKAISYFSKTDFSALPKEQQIQGKFQVGYSYFSDRKLEEALLYFNQVKFDEHAYSAAANYYAGFIEYSKAAYEEALTDLKRAEKNETYSLIVPYLIASVYYRKNQYDELLAYAAKLEGNEQVKNKKELLLLVAEAHYSKGDFTKAAAAYSESLQDKATGDAGVWYRAGLSNYKAGNTDEAIRLLELSAAAKEEVAAVASFQLGILYLQKGEKLYALNAFDRARKSGDKAIAEQAQFNFAKVAYDQGQSDKAIIELEKYLTDYPQGIFATETKELLAQAYVNGNNYNKAIEYIEALNRKSPVIEQAYQKATFLKGTEYFNKDNYTGAIVNFSKSLEYPRDEKYVQRASFWNAEAHVILHKQEEAVALYNQSIKSGSADLMLKLQAHYGVGYVLYNKKDFAKALVHFKEFVDKGNKQMPAYPDALLRLADCYYISKQFDVALNAYNQYKQTNAPDVDYAYLQSGLIYGLQRNYSASRTQFGTLISNFPASRYRAESMYQRAQFDIEQGNYQYAVDGLTQLIKSESTSAYVPYAYARRAASYFNLKSYEQTVSDYSNVVKLYPSHPLAQEVLLPLQEALELAGRSVEFDQYLASVKKANPDNKGLESLEFETSKKLYFNEQYEKAITSLQGFVQNYPQSALVNEANYYQAESYYRLKKYEQALPVYEKLKPEKTFTYAARVAARLAEVTFKLGKYTEAVANYHHFEGFATAKKDQYTALSGLMESFYLLAAYDSSDFYARQILERAAINAGAENKASLYLGKTAMARGDYDGAQDEFLNTLNAARDEYGAEAKYHLATIFYLKKEYKQSRETLISLNSDFASYDQWVGKSFLLLSDNALAQKDIFQAKATLQSLVDKFPIQSIRDEAALKLKELEQQQADEAKADSLLMDKQ